MADLLEVADDDLGLVYLDELKSPQGPVVTHSEVVQGKPKSTWPPKRQKAPATGIPVDVELDELAVCVGTCGNKVIPHNKYNKLPADQRRELFWLKVRRISARGLCETCRRKAQADGELSLYPVTPHVNEAMRLEANHDIPGIWAEILAAGGGYQQLADRVQCSAGTAYDSVKRLGLPQPMTTHRARNKARTEFIQELHQLVRFGVGTHDIAKAFSLTDDELIKKVDRLRSRGYTTVDLNYPEMETAA